MKRLLRTLDGFFFEQISANGFGLMRILWAATVFVFMVGSASDIVRYYSDAGIMPQDLGYLVFRSEYRFTLLQYITEPSAVILLWMIFMLCLLCMMVGIWPRIMTTLSVLLLFSFHERNLQPLGGGDTVLRTLGFILMMSPGISALSLDRLDAQWKNWQRTGKLLTPLTMSIWPYRLVLWQVIVIYVTSAWDKLQGTMWLDGTVIEAVFHHTHFVRWSMHTMNNWIWISKLSSVYTLVWEYAWLLLLVPRNVWSVLPQCMRKHSLRRWMIVGGLLFHGMIFVFMEVGTFPFAMATAYAGLLLTEDWAMFKRVLNRKWKGKIVVLFDGVCSLCTRSMFLVLILDSLQRTRAVNFRDATTKAKYAADVSEVDLDRAMHIKLPSSTYYKGFDAFRVLVWHLPVLRIFTPLLYLPGIPPIGRLVYKKIADSRNTCADGVCLHVPK